MRDKLSQKLNSISFSNPIYKGIGIHLIGYESIDNSAILGLKLNQKST
jgi:hypothetical protein